MIRPTALTALWPSPAAAAAGAAASSYSSCRYLVPLHVDVCRSSPLLATTSSLASSLASARGMRSGGVVRHLPPPMASGGGFGSAGTARRTLMTTTAGGAGRRSSHRGAFLDRAGWRRDVRGGTRVSDAAPSLRMSSTDSRGSSRPVDANGHRKNDGPLSQSGDGGDLRGVVDGDEGDAKGACHGAAPRTTSEAGSRKRYFAPLKSPLATAAMGRQSRASFLSTVQQASIFPLVLEVGKVAVGLAAVVLGLLYMNQEKMLYMPEIDGIPRRPEDNPPGYRSPEEYDIPFESVRIRSDDGVHTHAWFLLHPPDKTPRRSADIGGDKKMKRGSCRPTIIFFHGNAGNIGIRLPNARQMYELLDANVLMVEYRGYGDSDDDRPTERGLKLDAEAALRFALDHPLVDRDRIFVFGRSLGGAVGFHVTHYTERNEEPLAGLVVENTFLSVRRMVDEVLPILSPLKGLLLRMRWDCERLAPTIVSPTLYLSGDADEIVPHWHMRGLYDASVGGSCTLPRIHVVEGGTHNETWVQGGRAYWESMRRFIEEALSGR